MRKANLRARRRTCGVYMYITTTLRSAVTRSCSPQKFFLWFRHECCGSRMHLEHERYYAWGMHAPYAPCTRMLLRIGRGFSDNPMCSKRMLLWLGHGCYGRRMLLEDERCYGYYGLGVAGVV